MIHVIDHNIGSKLQKKKKLYNISCCDNYEIELAITDNQCKQFLIFILHKAKLNFMSNCQG